MSSTQTVRERLERLISNTPGRGVGLDFLCEQLAGTSREAVRNSLKHLVKLGVVMRHGSIRFPVYQSVLPNGSMGTDQTIRTAASAAASAGRPSGAPAAVRWPEEVKVQRVETAERLRSGQWLGVNWSQSVQRPGCQDHLTVPSRRGDARVPHRVAMGMRSSRKAV